MTQEKTNTWHRAIQHRDRSHQWRSTRPPTAPTLTATDNSKAVRIEFDVPKDGETHAAVHLHEAGGATRMYDAASKKVLPAGEKGRVVTLIEPEESQPPARKSLIATGLEGGAFEATVAFRRADDFDWGPTSPRSAPLVRAVPMACGAPLLEPVSDTEIRVHLAVPQGSTNGAVHFVEDGASSGRRVAFDTFTLRKAGETALALRHESFTLRKAGEKGKALLVTGGKTIVVEGLSSKISYTVSVAASNGIGWGPWSPLSKPMKLLDFSPPVPSAPVVDQIGADSARVFCAVLPTCIRATIKFRAVGTGVDLLVDHISSNKLVKYGGRAVLRAACYAGVVVPGLSPDTEYEVAYSQQSGFGWSRDSPRTKIRTLSDVEITGTKTREERDEELKRHAVDVDAGDDASPEKPAKRGKLEYGYEPVGNDGGTMRVRLKKKRP